MSRAPRPLDGKTRERMKRQRQAGTKPEVAVRAALSSLGERYRLQNKNLPGSPDLSNVRRGWALFVHGCYWHQHPGCPRATVPRNNRQWWEAKFEANRARDARKERALAEMGLRVVVVWECQTRDPETLKRRLAAEVVQAAG